MAFTPLHKVQLVPTSAPAQVGTTGVRRLVRVVMYCAADGICEFKNAATDTGDVLLTVSGLAKTTVDIDLTSVGGMVFGTAIYAKPTGTGNIVHVWFE